MYAIYINKPDMYIIDPGLSDRTTLTDHCHRKKCLMKYVSRIRQRSTMECTTGSEATGGCGFLLLGELAGSCLIASSHSSDLRSLTCVPAQGVSSKVNYVKISSTHNRTSPTTLRCDPVKECPGQQAEHEDHRLHICRSDRLKFGLYLLCFPSHSFLVV